MKRRDMIFSSAMIAGAAAGSQAFAEDVQGDDARFGDIVIPPEEEMGQEKHVPVIDAPDTAAAGEAFDVTVTVGETVPHPNTVEHHIKWIRLYAKYDDSRYAVEVASVDFGATYAQPKITVPVMLEKTATLYATEHCNIHGVWDFSKKVTVG